MGADPVGIYRRRGLPQSGTGQAHARVMLEGGSYLTLQVRPPSPHRGVGIEDYEVRPGELVVQRINTYSPAGRAEIEPGDRIVAIDGRRISEMTDAEAASSLSMAARRQTPLTVVRGAEPERTVELDRGYVWLIL